MLIMLQWTNTFSAIFKLGTFLPFLSLVLLLLVLPNRFSREKFRIVFCLYPKFDSTFYFTYICSY